MANAIVFVPITCPFCRHVTPVPFTRTEVIGLVESIEPIKLYSPCHNYSWVATPAEIQLMREALTEKPVSPNVAIQSIHRRVDSLDPPAETGADPYAFTSFEVGEAANRA
jgi:hypothetical protein